MTLQSSPTKIVPDNVVIGVPGDVVCCFPTTVQVKRRRPASRITEDELASLLERAQRLAARQLQDHPRASQQFGRGGWALTNAMVTEVQVDGQRVVDPLRFEGRVLQVTVVSVFAPGAFGQMAAALAADMDLQLMRLIAEPFALACSFPAGDAIFLDIGGDRTDVALVRRATVVAVDSLPLGSRSLTRQLARRLNLPFDRAEEVKIKRPALQQGPVPLAPKSAAIRSRAVAAAVEASSAAADASRRPSSLRGPAAPADPVVDCISQFAASWQQALAPILSTMSSHESLPLTIFLAGGGSQLPELAQALNAPAWLRLLPFDSLPRVTALPLREVRNLADRSQRLLGPHDLPLMALARLAAVADHPETLQDRLLKKVIGDSTVPFRR
jgi:cell division protein FtsA